MIYLISFLSHWSVFVIVFEVCVNKEKGLRWRERHRGRREKKGVKWRKEAWKEN